MFSTIKSQLLRSCATAAIIALPISGAALAQEQQTGQEGRSSTQQPQQQAQTGSGEQPAQGSAAQGSAAQTQQQAGAGEQQGGKGHVPPGRDPLVATVGEAEICGDDVLTVIGLLPEPLRVQQPDMLVPIALDQLVFRALILEQARDLNLSEDPEVQSLVQQSSTTAEENAMVQVWLRRELQNTVNDQAVQEAHDQLSRTSSGELPPLEQVRPQIEQHLRQQAPADIRQRLGERGDVIFYGPSGQPMQPSQTGAARSDGQDQQQQSAAGGDEPPVDDSASGMEEAPIRATKAARGLTPLRILLGGCAAGRDREAEDLFIWAS
jgi:hypothetical protein